MNISQDRIYILFFFFFSLITIFSIKITLISLKNPEVYDHNDKNSKFTILRSDIIDRNGIILSRNINSFHAAVNPRLIKNKNNFLIKIKINFPNIDMDRLKKNLSKEKYFYIKKKFEPK